MKHIFLNPLRIIAEVFLVIITLTGCPVRFGSGNLTCVTGIMTGTFIPSNVAWKREVYTAYRNIFSLPMCTVGVWYDRVMTEEYLHWNNQSYMGQIMATK